MRSCDLYALACDQKDVTICNACVFIIIVLGFAVINLTVPFILSEMTDKAPSCPYLSFFSAVIYVLSWSQIFVSICLVHKCLAVLFLN